MLYLFIYSPFYVYEGYSMNKMNDTNQHKRNVTVSVTEEEY